MQCQRIVKSYNDKSIEISGVNIANMQLGKLGIEPKVLHAASQALLILDASQYDLCISIKNMTDLNVRQEYIKKMADDKLQAQKIFRALAALSLNPQGAALQEAIKDLISNLLSSEQRTTELIKSNIRSESQQRGQNAQFVGTSDASTMVPHIKIGDNPFDKNIEEIKMQCGRNATEYIDENSHAKFTLRNNELDTQTKREMDDIRQSIQMLNDMYMNSKIEGKLDVDEFWSKNLGKAVQELTRNSRYRKIIGSVNTDILDRNIIKITGKIKELRYANDLEDTVKARVNRNEAELYINSIFRILDDIYLSIREE
jgi:hypothetical protein